MTSAIAEQRAAEVETDADQPRPEALVVAKAIETEHRTQRGLLGGIACELGVGQGAPAAGEQQGVVALDQCGERASVS